MATLPPFSSMAMMLQTSNIIWQSISLTDELKINLEYDVDRSALNIFVKNTSDNKDLSCQLNVLPSPCETKSILTPTLFTTAVQQDDDDDEPTIRYEVTTTYVYDLVDENEPVDPTGWNETRMPCSSSLSSSSSCFDDQTTDNDDGYSTHSLDDVEQQRLMTPSSQSIVSFVSSPSRHACLCDSEQYITPLRQLIEQLTWRNPFKKAMHDMMMMNHLFD